MLRIIDCLTLEHDAGIVALAALLCILGTGSTLIVLTRSLAAERPAPWVALLGLCFGTTAWSTHFIAMLAYRSSLSLSYDPLLTGLSLAAGIAVVTLGFLAVVMGPGRYWARLLGGATIGAGVIALHYIGMFGMTFYGQLRFDTDLVLLSIAFSVGFGALAGNLARADASRHQLLGCGAALVLLTVLLHFTGMSGTHLELGLQAPVTTPGITRPILIITVTLSSLFVLFVGLLASLIDQRVALRLAEEAERFRTLADGAFEGLIVHQDLTLIDANAAARSMLGLPEDIRGIHIGRWGIKLHRPADSDPEAGSTDASTSVEELALQAADGSTFPAEISRRAILLPQGETGELIAVRDLTERKRDEQKISHLALHDPLTDLPNRRFFTDLALAALRKAQREQSALAVLLVDLDNFKGVNDELGHGAGDELLRAVTSRLQHCASNHDVVARLGGDEFAILNINPDTDQHQGGDLAQGILEALREPITLAGTQVHAQASIGIAIYPQDGPDIDTLMGNADTAMYRAKADGKGLYRFFEAHMNVELERRRKLESRLQHAIANQTLAVHYQPLVSSKDHRPRGFEALMRWHDEELGPVSPVDFIPIAESSGLITRLGAFVLQRACADAVTWPDPLRVAVNLSAIQFERDGLVDLVRQTLADTGLPGKRLELEITESLLIENQARAIDTLGELKALGVRIAMDDFGTGYSSLSYLQSFAFNKIKIDRSFVSHLEHNTADASIIEAVVAMGHSLQMSIVAEGVETEDQAAILNTLNCDELQGYLFAKPMPAADVLAFLDISPDAGAALGKAA